MPKYIKEDDVKIIKATREFTDREEPRKAFWEKYNSVNDKEIKIISYYGFGGIGKSTLLLKLKDELLEKEKNHKFEFLDMEKIDNPNNVLEILNTIKKDLKNKYNFSFPIFELVEYEYNTKLGKTATRPELSNIFDNNKELGFLKDVVSEIPLIGSFAKIIYYADQGKNLLKERLQNYKLRERLLAIRNMSASNLKEYLPYYFAIDFKENIKNDSKPFVFFIDTYELLVNELTQRGDVLSNDLWLRSDEGLICRIPNVLWVIAGREKLKWAEIDTSWNESLDQHLLGTLSLNDATHFLKTAGVEDLDLIHEIYSLTHGTPMYLDMCVDTYIKIIEKGATPTIKDFGTNTTKLVKRFLMYMDDSERDFTIMLAHIPSWNDDNIEEISMKMNGTFSYSLYEKVKSFSFIEEENNNYKMHESIKDIIIANTPKIMQKKYASIEENDTNKEIEKIISNEEKVIKEEKYSINTYTSRTSFLNIIKHLINNLATIKEQSIFQSKAKSLIHYIQEYENRYDMPINIASIYSHLFEDIAIFKNTLEYKILKSYNHLELDLEEADLNSIKRYIRFTDKHLSDEEYHKLKKLLKDHSDLYYIKVLTLGNDGNKDECNILFDQYNGEINTFYIETLINLLDTTKEKNPKIDSSEDKLSFTSLDRVTEEFNSISGGLHELNTEIAMDAGNYDTTIPKENERKIKLMIKCFQDNPSLINTKILNEMLSLSGQNFNDETKKILLEYLYSIIDIPLNSTDTEIIDNFYSLFKKYLGGDYNIIYYTVNDEDTKKLAIDAITKFKDKYIELYGDNSVIVNDTEIFIIKNQIKDNPKLFKKILNNLETKYGIDNPKFGKTIMVLTKEIKNHCSIVKTLNTEELKWFDNLIEYGLKISESLEEVIEKDDVNIYSHTLELIYQTLEEIYFQVDNENNYDKMYKYCYSLIKYYQLSNQGAEQYEGLFLFTSKCLNKYSENPSKTYYIKELENVANMILNNLTKVGQLNQYTLYYETILTKYTFLMLYNDLSNYVSLYKDKIKDTYFLKLYNENNVNELRKYHVYKNYKECEWYHVLIAHALVKEILPRSNYISFSYNNLIRFKTKNDDYHKEYYYEIYVLLDLIRVFDELSFKRWRTNNPYNYDLYAHYLCFLQTVAGNFHYDISKISKINKKFHLRTYDKDKLQKIDQLRDAIIYMRYKKYKNHDYRFSDVAKLYNEK